MQQELAARQRLAESFAEGTVYSSAMLKLLAMQPAVLSHLNKILGLPSEPFKDMAIRPFTVAMNGAAQSQWHMSH